MLLYIILGLWVCWSVFFAACILNEDLGGGLLAFFKGIGYSMEQGKPRNIFLRLIDLVYGFSALPAILIAKGLSGLPEYCEEMYIVIRRVFDQDYKG